MRAARLKCQLLAVLIDPNLQDGFTQAFFLGRYSIEFTRTDAADVRTYYVEQGLGKDVKQAFWACMQQMINSLPPD
jgi:hypothetical protein